MYLYGLPYVSNLLCHIDRDSEYLRHNLGHDIINIMRHFSAINNTLIHSFNTFKSRGVSVLLYLPAYIIILSLIISVQSLTTLHIFWSFEPSGISYHHPWTSGSATHRHPAPGSPSKKVSLQKPNLVCLDIFWVGSKSVVGFPEAGLTS